MNLRPLAILALGVLLFSGCSAPTFLTLYNHTGDSLTIRVADREYEIKDNSPLTVQYPGTQWMEISDGRRTVGYKFVVPPGKFNRPIWNRSTETEIFCQLEPDGRIYIVFPKTAMPALDVPPQPAGFPLTGSDIHR